MTSPSTHTPSTVHVDVGHHQYPIYIGQNTVAELPEKITHGAKVFVVSDATVLGLHGERLKAILPDAHFLEMGQGEAEKTDATLFAILHWLLDHKAKRSDVLLAFGGGIVGDVTGLAASLLKRGMKFIQIPTTLLAQVDSSVGGKTAINTKHGKNLIGAFYQPEAVYIDLDFLQTLPPRQISAGLAEIIKYGIIRDPDLFAYLEAHAQDIAKLDIAALTKAIKRSCEIKAEIVATDETEKGQRALLNFGHTFGHALEALNGYGPDLLHGEAVAIGMGLAARYANRLGFADNTLPPRIDAVMAASNLPLHAGEIPENTFTSVAMLDAMAQDKKASNKGLPLILTAGLGKGFIHPNTDLEDLATFLESEFPT